MGRDELLRQACRQRLSVVSKSWHILKKGCKAWVCTPILIKRIFRSAQAVPVRVQRDAPPQLVAGDIFTHY